MAVQPKKIRLILASSSPRRISLLREAGYDFDTVAPEVNEPHDSVGELLPSQYAEALAYFKARAVAEKYPGRCILAADTIVSLGGRILGKSVDEAEAGKMLAALSGTRHAVITGVALLQVGSMRMIASETTYVTMRKMTPDQIDKYIASGEWIGKAGSYAIQESGDRFIERIEGSFSNVVGLPVELVDRMFSEIQEHPESHRVI